MPASDTVESVPDSDVVDASRLGLVYSSASVREDVEGLHPGLH